MSTQRTVWVVIQSASGVIVAVASVITLMLMSINIYYQFVMKLHEIKVSILAETAMISGWIKDSFTFQMVFTNSGNQPVIISQVILEFPELSSDLRIRHFIGWGEAPILLEPGKIILKTIAFPFYDKDGVLLFSANVKGAVVKEWGTTIKAKIQFIVIDSLGNEHKVDYDDIEVVVKDGKVTCYPYSPKAIILLHDDRRSVLGYFAEGFNNCLRNILRWLRTLQTFVPFQTPVSKGCSIDVLH